MCEVRNQSDPKSLLVLHYASFMSLGRVAVRRVVQKDFIPSQQQQIEYIKLRFQLEPVDDPECKVSIGTLAVTPVFKQKGEDPLHARVCLRLVYFSSKWRTLAKICVPF